MVSTRSHSVLSGGAQGAAAATAGEVNSGSAATPRRSGRLRSSGGSAAATPKAAPRSTRSVRNRRLTGIEEAGEADALQREEGQQEQQEAEGEGASGEQQAETRQLQADQQEQLSPHAHRQSAKQVDGRLPAAAASPSATASQPEKQASAVDKQAEVVQEAEAEAAGAAPMLTAEAGIVDVLAQQMFAALGGSFGNRQDSSGSESDADDEDHQQQPQAGSDPQGAGGAGEEQGAMPDGGSRSDSDGSSGSEDEDGAGYGVPTHLRWQPELTLPKQLSSRTAAAVGGSGTAAAVHAVRKYKDGLHVAPPDQRAQQRAERKERPDTAGKGWFDLPATQITDEVKNDLRMLRLRGALDPKAHYKKLDSTKFPKYFQMGTVVEGAADFYSGRLTNKQRKRTLTEEVMADGHLTQVRKKRFTKLQEDRSYWSKKKGPKKKTGYERKEKSQHRPKH